MPRPLNFKPAARSYAARQRGVALYVALIVLVVMTVIGIALLGNTGLQTKMAYSASESQFAFASAETALAAGEDWLEAQNRKPTADCTCPQEPSDNFLLTCSALTSIWPRVGITTPPVTSTEFLNEQWWSDCGRRYGYSFTDVAASAEITGQTIAGTNSVPRYIIEDLGPDPSGSLVVGQGVSYQIYYFQITARGFGAQSNAQTLVQSVYAKGF